MRPISAKRRPFFFAGAALITTLLFGGCPQTPPADDDAPDPNSTISFANQVQPILTARCATCHRAGGFAAFSGIALRLDEANAYNGLTTLTSSRVQGLQFVVPADSAASYLFEKITSDDPRSGARMPLAEAPLTANQIETIRLWIEQGALNN